MLAAVKGYYDGTKIVVDERDRKTFNIGDEVIITILDKISTTREETRAAKRRRIVDMEKYVIPSERGTEEIDNYIREMREDRIIPYSEKQV